VNLVVSPAEVTGERERSFADFLALFSVPKELAGKTCLDLTDLGQDFGASLTRRGASEVVTFGGFKSGIADQEALLAISGQFDYIFVYLDRFFDCDVQIVTSFLRTRVKPSGLVAVEVSSSGSLFERRWTATTVSNELAILPTFGEVAGGILAGFSVRDLGRVPAGLRADHTTAFVCRRLQPIVLLIGGKSGSGKTTLARELSRAGVKVLNFDFLYSEILYQAKAHSVDGLDDIMSRFDPSKIGSSIDAIVSDGFAEQLVDLTLPYFRSSSTLTVAEGYQFAVPAILEITVRKLTERRFRVQSLIMG